MRSLLHGQLTAFIAGFLALGLEIVAGRLLAPYFGSSLFQWAALIGVVLIAYAAGYRFFERLTPKGPAMPLALGAIYVLLLPFWLNGMLDRILFLPMSLSAVVAATLAVGIPSLLWSSVLPYLQREAGTPFFSRILVWSACGNLAGAWGVAFLAIPELGTRLSLIAHGVFALLLGMSWMNGRSLKARILPWAGLALAILQLSWVESGRAPWETLKHSLPEFDPTLERKLIHAGDTAYQHVAVWDERRPDGTIHRALALGGSLQFLWSERETLTRGDRYEYYNYSTAAALWATEVPAQSALILGLGGGLIPWQLQRAFPKIEISAFEIDEELVRIAERHLPLSQANGVQVRVGDGRVLLRDDTKTYDFILLDTFLNSYVPFHLTTREFFEQVKRRLAPGGVLIANFHTVFRLSGLLPKLEATIGSVFPVGAAMDLNSGTTLMMASNSGPDFPIRLRRASGSSKIALAHLSAKASALLRPLSTADDPGVEILTDDRNDTEQRLYETRKYILVSNAP